MEVHYNDYIIKGSMKVVDVVNLNGYDNDNNKSNITFIHLLPVAPVKIFDHRAYENDTEGIPIEYYMEWIELVDDSIDEYIGEFSGPIAITPDDIIKAK